MPSQSVQLYNSSCDYYHKGNAPPQGASNRTELASPPPHPEPSSSASLGFSTFCIGYFAFLSLSSPIMAHFLGVSVDEFSVATLTSHSW